MTLINQIINFNRFSVTTKHMANYAIVQWLYGTVAENGQTWESKNASYASLTILWGHDPHNTGPTLIGRPEH